MHILLFVSFLLLIAGLSIFPLLWQHKIVQPIVATTAFAYAFYTMLH